MGNPFVHVEPLSANVAKSRAFYGFEPRDRIRMGPPPNACSSFCIARVIEGV